MIIPRVGQLIKSPAGLLRIARAVHIASDDPKKVWVSFAIKHCSWTRRCYTVYSLDELLRTGYTVTRKRVKFNKFDKRVNTVIHKSSKEMTCCDVEGIS